jgi:uncharacterized ion transporter superfamily protein YfcC
MKPRFQFNTLLMIYAVVVLVGVLTWFMPGGEYQRIVKDGKNLVVPGSFTAGAAAPQFLGAMLLAPIKGFVQAAQIIICLFVVGGCFAVLQKTGAIAAAIHRLALLFSQKPRLRRFFIPLTMTLFSLGGAVFGMCEETMPFVLIFIPLSLSLGYDSLVGTAIPFLGAAAGFAGSIFNPFTVGIAQSIAELPLYSGAGYRTLIWALSTACMIAFVMRHASRIEMDPKLSPVHDIDQERKHALRLDGSKMEPLLHKHKRVLGGFAAALLLLVWGVFRYKWYINEISALFLGLGVAGGVLGGLSADEFTDSFKEGAKDMVGVALIIACARGTLVVATDGKILDSMLHGMESVIRNVHPVFCAQAMFVAQGTLNFFIHSGSGQAALTMPIMAPLADVVGVTRQTAVLAFQFGEGWINPILPTSGVTMGVLGLAGIPWDRWFKWMLPAQIFFFILALLLLIPPFLMNWQ